MAVFIQELVHIVFGDQHGLRSGRGHTDVAVYRLCGWLNRDIDMLGLRIPTLDGFSGDDRTVMDGDGIWLNFRLLPRGIQPVDQCQVQIAFPMPAP